jgi:hypothetical protein
LLNVRRVANTNPEPTVTLSERTNIKVTSMTKERNVQLVYAYITAVRNLKCVHFFEVQGTFKDNINEVHCVKYMLTEYQKEGS